MAQRVAGCFLGYAAQFRGFMHNALCGSRTDVPSFFGAGKDEKIGCVGVGQILEFGDQKIR